MPKPGENKTVQSRILTYAQEIAWELVSRDEAQARRGFNNHNGNIQEKALISNLSSKQDEQNLSNLDSNSTDKTLSREWNSTDKALSREYHSTDKKSYLDEMPESLRQSVQSLGQRVDRTSVRVYTIPENPNSPSQAYRTGKSIHE